ncbi:ComEA family DNA-binding protein [Paenibacillus albicereus]|uniref:ComEA family DNA-binding protein n=1 Tax=Paenibacillus albicereus TaxID=2726185 RepID=A0A6H2H434_9BACL|nr:ComEA family DNA-binding protein [Paenibacillus albicereus]
MAKEDEGDGTADADRVDGAGGGRSEEDRAGSGQAEAQPAGGYAADGRLDLNRATAEELDGLPGVGPAKAKAIVEDRERNGPFASVDEVERVKGIGPKLLEKWKNLVVVSQEM